MMREIYQNKRQVVLFALSILVAAINFNLLLKPLNLVSGGSGGLALVLQNIINISTSHIIAIIYVIMVILSLIFLSKKTAASIILASILYPACTYLTEDIANVIYLNYDDVFLIAIISGVVSGITNGIAFRYGYATGGLGVLAPIINKYLKASISTVNFVVNTIIVLLGAYYYGFNMVLYAVMLLYLSSYITNLIIIGLSSDKVIFIKSDNNKEILELLHNKYSINATILEDNDENTLMAVVKNIDYNAIKLELKKIDKQIFFTTNNCYETGHKNL